jgi:transposase
MKRSRRQFSGQFKAKVAIEAIKEVKTLQQLAEQYEVHPTVIARWKREFLEGASRIFDEGNAKEKVSPDKDQQQLFRKIGELQMENDFLKKVLEQLG